MSKGESIFRGAGITVEDEFTNDNFDEEEEAGEGWIEEGHEVKREEIEGLEEPYLLLLPPDPESDTEQPPPSRSLQNRVIHIQASPDSAKPAVSGLRNSGQQALTSSRQELKTVFICPEPHCKLRLPTQASVATHVATCHGGRVENEVPESQVDSLPCEEDGDADDLMLGEERREGARKRKRAGTGGKEGKQLQCSHCQMTAESIAELRTHVKVMHEEQKTYQCTECNIKVSRKYHLVRHIKAVHQKEKFWQCEDCDYKTNNQVCFKKHKNNKHEGEDCDNVYSVDSLALRQEDESLLRCVCTWCPFKSSKYSVVKKHIEIHHERKHHYPCKECVFVGQSVDDYAEHYHTFHKMDEYKHACTDCSFKCTNKHDLKIHYSEMHSKQRQRFFACPMCDHKSNDVNNMKRHINTVHHSDARRVYRCDQCEFQSEQKTLLLQHRYSAHEGLTISAGEGDGMQEVKITLFNANSGDES